MKTRRHPIFSTIGILFALIGSFTGITMVESFPGGGLGMDWITAWLGLLLAWLGLFLPVILGVLSLIRKERFTFLSICAASLPVGIYFLNSEFYEQEGLVTTVFVALPVLAQGVVSLAIPYPLFSLGIFLLTLIPLVTVAWYFQSRKSNKASAANSLHASRSTLG